MTDAQLVARMRKGCVESRNALIERHQGIAHYVVRRMNVPEQEREDMAQVALLALCKKLPRYNPKRARIVTFAYLVCYRAICDWIRRCGTGLIRDKRKGKDQEPIPVFSLDLDCGNGPLARVIPDPCDRFARYDADEEVQELLKALTPDTLDVVEWRYGLNGYAGKRYIGSRHRDWLVGQGERQIGRQRPREGA